MNNIRVYEAAKELGLSNKEMIEQLEQKIGVVVKSHSSTLTLSQFEKFKAAIKPATSDAPKKPKAFIVKKAKPKSDAPAQEKPQVVVEKIEKPVEPVVKETPVEKAEKPA